MTSTLVGQLLEREGLLPLLAMRDGGEIPGGSGVDALLARAEILALGAAADVARRRECGDETRIYVPSAPARSAAPVLGRETPARGTALLRLIARERLTGPIGGRIIIDFGAVGLEIAQVALSFGATDLAGPIASRKGLPIVDPGEAKKMVKQSEIAGFVERAGFRPVFVTISDVSASPGAPADRADENKRTHVDP